MATPDFGTLAAREDVWVRETTHEVDSDRFASARDRIEDDWTWAVGAVVTDEDGRVLLVREDDQWLAPGGKVEPGETLDAALVREVREETGVDVTVADLVAITEVGFEYAGERISFQFAHYTATPAATTLAEDPGRAGEDIETVAWAEEIPSDTVDREVLVAHR